MYLETIVDIPKNNPKITIKTNKYVMYEIDRIYNKDKRNTKPIRITIGKVSKEDKTKMIPKEEYSIFFPEIELSDTVNETIKRSSCLKIGNYVLLDKLFSSCKIKELIDCIFSDRSGIIKDLVAYSIVNESNVAQYFEDYAYNHPLFTEDMKIYSDSYISKLFSEYIKEDEIITFLNAYNQMKNKDNTIYISYDSTNFNCQALDIEMAEMGHAKDKEDKPIVNLAIGYDLKNSEPLFYEEYPGSINDVSQLNTMIDKANGYGYKNIGFVLDRGYFSRDNIRKMDELGYKYIIAAKGSAKFLKGLIDEVIDDFKIDRDNYSSIYKVYGTTYKKELFSNNHVKGIHVYYNETRAAIEKDNLESDIYRQQKRYFSEYGKKVVHKDNDFFRFIYNDKQELIDVEINNDNIKNVRKYMGYFCLICFDNTLDWKSALELYKSRDTSEKLFRADKSFLGQDAIRVQSNNSIKAKTFINFLALILRNKMYRLLKDESINKCKFYNYMTTPKAIKELDKIEIIKGADGTYRLDHAITKTQKDILSAFGLDQGVIVMEVPRINKK